jgi:spore germination protein KB
MLSYIAIILYIISALGLSFQIKLTNIEPILENGFLPVIKGVYNYIAYMILPIFFILIVPKNQIDSKKLNKGIIITYFITNLCIFIVMFLVISVFGIELTKLYQYPSYHILKRVFIGGFIERMENTLSLQWIITLFISSLFTEYYTVRTLKDNFNLNNKLIIFIAFIIMYISQYIFKNNTLSEVFFAKYYPIVMGIFLILIPLLITVKLAQKKDTKVSFKEIKN